jgi:hypothetical protein
MQRGARQFKPGRGASSIRGVLLEKALYLIAALEAHVETLKAQLAAVEARALASDVRANEEAAKTAQAIAAFEGPRAAARSYRRGSPTIVAAADWLTVQNFLLDEFCDDFALT